jgi:uncharacterized membrane protein (DUF485 family)
MDNINPAAEAAARAQAPAYSPEVLAAAQQVTRERLRFAVPAAAVSLGAYVGIAALTGFTDVLGTKVHGAMSLTLLLLMLLVPLVWGLTLAYRRQADRWDALTAEIRRSTSPTTGPTGQESGR